MKYIPTLEDRVVALRDTVQDFRRPKGTREAALRELRSLELKIGLPESYPNGYNHGRIDVV
jgi:hypothetical protein